MIWSCVEVSKCRCWVEELAKVNVKLTMLERKYL